MTMVLMIFLISNKFKILKLLINKIKAESKFFFIDDFFYWLGCKFVTCDKAKQELEKAQ